MNQKLATNISLCVMIVVLFIAFLLTARAYKKLHPETIVDSVVATTTTTTVLKYTDAPPGWFLLEDGNGRYALRHTFKNSVGIELSYVVCRDVGDPFTSPQQALSYAWAVHNYDKQKEAESKIVWREVK